MVPSPGTPGEVRVRVLPETASNFRFEAEPSPCPLPEYRERENGIAPR
jgi:hypothetical protein